MTDDEKHDFIADVTAHLLEDIDKGVDIFVVLSFRHDKDRDSMQVTNSTVQVGKTVADDRMADTCYELVAAFMNAHAPRWAQ